MYNQLRSSIMPFTWKNVQGTQDKKVVKLGFILEDKYIWLFLSNHKRILWAEASWCFSLTFFALKMTPVAPLQGSDNKISVPLTDCLGKQLKIIQKSNFCIMSQIKFTLEEKVFCKNQNWIFTIIKYYNDWKENQPVEIFTVRMMITEKKSFIVTFASGLKEKAVRRKGCH